MDFKDMKDPFGFPVMHYIWVLGLACLGGLVKHMNTAKEVKFTKLFVDLVSSAFTGVMTFWLCESTNIHGPLSAILISVGGLMGNRAWSEFESIWRAKFGVHQHNRRETDHCNECDDNTEEGGN